MSAAHTLLSRTPLGELAPKRRRLVLAGAGMLLLGLAAPTFPLAATLAVGFMAGWLLWLAGAITFGFSMMLLPGRLRLVSVLASLFIIAVGVLLTARPTLGALATAVLLGAVFIVDGSLQAVLALRLRPAGPWRAVLASAFASLAAAALFFTGWPERSPQAVGLLLALAFLTTGGGFMVLGLAGRTPRQA